MTHLSYVIDNVIKANEWGKTDYKKNAWFEKLTLMNLSSNWHVTEFRGVFFIDAEVVPVEKSVGVCLNIVHPLWHHLGHLNSTTDLAV